MFTSLAWSANSNPSAFVYQAAKNNGLRFEGENALKRYDWDAYNQIRSWVYQGLSTFN